MANKTQAKAAVDAGATAIKADIDSTLPVGVDIVDGTVTFNPTKWHIRLNSTTQGAADTLAVAIEAALTTAVRPWTETRGGRRTDDGIAKFIRINSTLASYQIMGF